MYFLFSLESSIAGCARIPAYISKKAADNQPLKVLAYRPVDRLHAVVLKEEIAAGEVSAAKEAPVSR